MESQERMNQIRQTIDVMIRTMHLHHRIVENRIDGLGVHHSQHRLLMRLSKMGSSASQRELAESLDVSPACVARALKPLSAAGLVEKAEGSDGRCNAVSVLPKGRQLVDDSLAVFRQIGSQMFDGLTEEELTTLGALMARVRNNLTEMEGRQGQEGGDGEGSVECQ